MANDKLRVKLLVRIAGIGKEGDIVEVSHAQAKNALIPKKLAVLIDDRAFEEEKARVKKRQDEKRHVVENRHKIAETLHAKTIRFELAGSGEKIFGGIGEHEIIERIKSDFGVTLERKHIALPDGHHLKKAGSADVKIHL
jgi:large subunit ribosomal protein L9